MRECSNHGLSVWHLINKKEVNKQWFIFDNLVYLLLVLKKKSKSIFRYIKFLSMPQRSGFWAAVTHQKFGEGESAAERAGSLDPTAAAPPPHQDLPKASEARGTRQQPRALETNGKISTDFRQVSVSSRHLCSRHISDLIYFNSQLNTFQLILTIHEHIMLSCLAPQVNRAEWPILEKRKTLLVAWDGGIHTDAAPTCLHETRSEVHNKDNSILLGKKKI